MRRILTPHTEPTQRNRPASQGNTEGTPARVRASTCGHSFFGDSSGFRRFRGRRDPRLPSLPASELNGKEGAVECPDALEGCRKSAETRQHESKAASLLQFLRQTAASLPRSYHCVGGEDVGALSPTEASRKRPVGLREDADQRFALPSLVMDDLLDVDGEVGKSHLGFPTFGVKSIEHALIARHGGATFDGVQGFRC
jgi:hypothetical protein